MKRIALEYGLGYLHLAFEESEGIYVRIVLVAESYFEGSSGG